MTKAKQSAAPKRAAPKVVHVTPPAAPAKAKADPEFVCIVDRVNFDDGAVLLRDQKIALSEAEAQTYLKAETLARV